MTPPLLKTPPFGSRPCKSQVYLRGVRTCFSIVGGETENAPPEDLGGRPLCGCELWEDHVVLRERGLEK